MVIDLSVSAREGTGMRVLDAGCGGGDFYAAYPDAYVIGIDLDEEALSRNSRADERIVGDLRSYPFEPNSFDAIICHDVLEHISNPAAVLRNFAEWVRPGGTISLGFPNVLSGKGLVTKLTPHSFHVWFYRAILGSAKAGTPGYGPYKTYLRFAISPILLRRTAPRLGVQVESVNLHNGDLRPRSRVLTALMRPFLLRSECSIVLRKR
jgi:SAM-dependent methyltransferase